MSYISTHKGTEIDTAVTKILSLETEGGAASQGWVNTQLDNYILKSDAVNTYLNINDASSIYLTKTDASTTYLAKNVNTNAGVFLRGDNTWSNYLAGPLRIGASDTAANTGYATDNVGSNNYIAFYGVYGDNPGSFNHTYIGERIYGSKSSAQEQSELLLFKGNDIGTADPGPDRIRLLAAQVDVQCYSSTLSGSFMSVGETGGTQVLRCRPDLITASVPVLTPTIRFNGGVAGSVDLNSYTTTGIYFVSATSNYATSSGNHGVLFVFFNVGTPFQVFWGDSSIAKPRKRYYSGGTWSAWYDF